MPKKILYSWLFWGLVFIVCMFKACTFISEGMCSNAIYSQAFSPNGEFKAVAFSRDCGATTSFSTHVSLLHSNDNLANEAGNTFISKGSATLVNPSLAWHSNSNLRITFSNQGKVFKANKEYSGNVAVSYSENGS